MINPIELWPALQKAILEAEAQMEKPRKREKSKLRSKFNPITGMEKGKWIQRFWRQ